MKTYYSRAAGVRTTGKTFSLESREVRMRLNTLAAAFLGAMFLLALAGCGRSKTQTEARSQQLHRAPISQRRDSSMPWQRRLRV